MIKEVLDRWSIEQKLHRMALQIVERNLSAPQIAVIGLKERGNYLGVQLANKLSEVGDIPIITGSISLNGTDWCWNDKPSIDPKSTHLIMVDDVCKSGRTFFETFPMIHELKPLSVQIAVLVDRTYKSFPVHCDYVGLQLNTTATEHITVHFDAELAQSATLQ